MSHHEYDFASLRAANAERDKAKSILGIFVLSCAIAGLAIVGIENVLMVDRTVVREYRLTPGDSLHSTGDYIRYVGPVDDDTLSFSEQPNELSVYTTNVTYQTTRDVTNFANGDRPVTIRFLKRDGDTVRVRVTTTDSVSRRTNLPQGETDDIIAVRPVAK